MPIIHQQTPGTTRAERLRHEHRLLGHDRRLFLRLVLHLRHRRTREDKQHSVRIRRHCHQLFHRLRGRKDHAATTGGTRELGHFDDLLRQPAGPRSAAQEHRGSAPWERRRRTAPRCAAGSAGPSGSPRPPPCGVLVVQLEVHHVLPGVDRLLAS